MIESLFHYYRKGSRPFQSLSALDESQAVPLMNDMYVPGSVLWQRFGSPLAYLRLRKHVEQELRSKFKDKGGHPKQDYPIYLVVGRPRWAVPSADAVTMDTTDEIRVPLTILREDEVSFTYPDSMYFPFFRQMIWDPNVGSEYEGKVFTIKEIEMLIATNGLPAEGWKPELPAHLSHYIEAQVWSQTVLEEYLGVVGEIPRRDGPEQNS